MSGVPVHTRCILLHGMPTGSIDFQHFSGSLDVVSTTDYPHIEAVGTTCNASPARSTSAGVGGTASAAAVASAAVGSRAGSSRQLSARHALC